jgi:transposase InsO family protein
MRSNPGHPQTNGAVERLNRTLSDLLQERYANKAASGVPWNFIHDLREIVENYNRTVHRITNKAPVNLLTETDAEELKMVRQHER